jgi:preprotein translocase subunit SecA
MINEIITKIFWDPSEKKVKFYMDQIENIKNKELEFKNFNLIDVKNKTLELKTRFEWLDFKISEDNKEIKRILEDIKYDAFALVKTACKLIDGNTFELSEWKQIEWNMIPYDVQLVWALAIHGWSISEMKTWEWKTLVATMPAYLNALTWNPVHIVTVNDYLAKRDSEEMGILYNALGLKVGFITNDQDKETKKENYKSDIVYATNNELWFDYLRDNMVRDKQDKSQSRMFFAIIDEVDSILIDEARTPLIISQPDNEPTSKYLQFSQIAKMLESGKDYKIDEKQKTATLTEDWIEKVEKLLKVENIYVSENYNDLHHIENAIKASWVYIKDKDYIVSKDEVNIVDEHTWRVLSGRRYSDWLHQAIEAKEWVTIQQESKTLASITFQNYFRMYSKLSWMTGTAKTEEEEFYKVYGLETLVIPTNKPISREDRADLLFKNEKGKFDYVVKFIREINETWRPILVWTVSVDKSEYLSSLLSKAKIKHNVLNAKQNDREAEIVWSAWERWAVTIATNMAWRGTDIKLWEWVAQLWWLFIIGTEKHETRRIDNQLRGRAWRQWDSGTTGFLVSPSDDIMRIFWWDKMFSLFNSSLFASMPDDEPLPSGQKMLTKKITSVQKQVEWHNFDIRKHVLEYDDVINKHRDVIYYKRDNIIDSENIDEDIKRMIVSQVTKLVISEFTKDPNLDKKKLIEKINHFLEVNAINDTTEIDDISAIETPELASKYISNIALEEFEKIKEKASSPEYFYELERKIVLSSIDELWMRHIDSMSKLREEVAFEWYAQRQPLVVYKEKAYMKFSDLLSELEYKVTKIIFSLDKSQNVEKIIEVEHNSNPLFASTTTAKNTKSQNRRPEKKKKIRV